MQAWGLAVDGTCVIPLRVLRRTLDIRASGVTLRYLRVLVVGGSVSGYVSRRCPANHLGLYRFESQQAFAEYFSTDTGRAPVRRSHLR